MYFQIEGKMSIIFRKKLFYLGKLLRVGISIEGLYIEIIA